MRESEIILGLFFADEYNIIYETIKFSGKITELKNQELMVLPLKYFGPIFLTKAYSRDANWKIESIESTLSFKTQKSEDIEEMNVIQALFNLNSSITTSDGETNLFVIIGSPHTEDIDLIFKKMTNYIHPCIIQIKELCRELFNSKVHLQKFIDEELERGINLIEYTLGSSRKIPWEKQHKYYCVGIIERKISYDMEFKECNIYTFDVNSPLREKYLDEIPSYYVMTTLPDYYEKLTNITLQIFDMINLNSNIREIELRSKELGKTVLYLEEYSEEKGIKHSYGVVLIPNGKYFEDSNNKSYFKKNLRLILDKLNTFEEIIEKINPNLTLYKWGTNSEYEREKIQEELDKKE